MNKYKTLAVSIGGHTVGTLAVDSRHLVHFEYSGDWLEHGYSLNPLSLPLKKGVFSPKGYEPFEGLFGVFADSLPDGWGRLLVDRFLKKEGFSPAEIDSLNRLAIVGTSGAGALEYHPTHEIIQDTADLSLDEISKECQKMLISNETEHLDDLFRMGGSSGGARPKIFYRWKNQDWIVKFPASIDTPEIGRQEYEYALCAKKCGIAIPTVQLFDSKECAGFFAVERFDRKNADKIHMVSVSALLEPSHRIPNLDYDILMQLTMILTKSYTEIEKLYRQMCFNVFAHNRDDHSKNFSFLCKKGKWELSPAYDLTYSSSIGGEHATTIHGNGRNPGMQDLLAVAREIKFDEKKAKAIAQEIQETVQENLSEWIGAQTKT